MKGINEKHWFAIEKIIDELKEDQKSELTSEGSPIEIAKRINQNEIAINSLKELLVVWKEDFGYPNTTALKYVHRY